VILISTLVLVSCTSSPRFSAVKSKQENRSRNLTRESARSINKSRSYKAPEKLSDFDDLLIKEAQKWLGTPYQYGGIDFNGIDCSAFVQNVMKSVGIDVPRTAAQQYEFSYSLPLSKAKLGDLVFFKEKSKVSHVGIYLGGDKFVHSSTSKGVIYSSLNDSWYQDNFYKVGRVKF
jgi:cell wall-associated NlpC family hydrolase